MKVLAVCVGRVGPLQRGARSERSAIVKTAVAGAVAVHRLGLDGDEQADLGVHGGIARAVHAYPHEHYAFWQTVRAQAGVAAWDAPLAPGSLGENLLLEGVTEERLWIGDRLHVGRRRGPGCVLAVSEPRLPCAKFDAAMGFVHASRMMLQSGWCGAYLGVVEPGDVSTGDLIEIEPGPREVNLRELFRARAPSATASR